MRAAARRARRIKRLATFQGRRSLARARRRAARCPGPERPSLRLDGDIAFRRGFLGLRTFAQ